jgi:hypothetical protein
MAAWRMMRLIYRASGAKLKLTNCRWRRPPTDLSAEP